jgi:transposase
MAKVRSWAGLDVHAARVVAVTVDGESGELRARGLSGETREVVAFCAALPGPTKAAYEAGPTGFGLARALQAAGVGCVVAAPGKIERPAQDRVKTDRRDAERLVRLLMVGGLHPVRVPGTEEEAVRDLVRAREDVRGDLMRARHRLNQSAAAPRRPLRRQRRQLDPTSPGVAEPGRARRGGSPGHAA